MPCRRSSQLLLLLLLLLLPLGLAGAQENSSPTEVGSWAPDVYLDDIAYTIRFGYPRTVVVSPANPDVAYVGSWDGYVWKTVDGGQTWDESRLIVEPFSFYGDLGERIYLGIHRSPGYPSFSLGDVASKLLEKSPNDFRSATGDAPQMDSGGGGGGGGIGGAAGNVNFGIGLPGSAPRLQLLVRKFGKPTSGMNIKQTLWLRGVRPTEIRILVIHPEDPNIVFACTAFGLFKTYDGGLNWVRTFIGVGGSSPVGRMAFHLAIDPSNPKKVLLATGEGVYVSVDGGDNFLKSPAKGVGEGVIDWIYFNPYDSRYVFVGTDAGLLRSSDGGQNWDWIYFTTFPTARVVRSVVIDPFDKRTGYIATHDGMFYTPDILHGGLDAWKRLGGLQFTGVETSKIHACPRHKGHLWVLTNMKLPKVTSPGLHDSGGSFIMESMDGGKTWKVLFSGNTLGAMQWFDNDPRDPDLLWLIWSRSMTRMRRRTTQEKTTRRRMTIPDDPPIGEVIKAALQYTGTDPSRELTYRRRSRLKALVPRLDARFTMAHWDRFPLLQDGLYPTLPFRRTSDFSFRYKEFRVMLFWDLSPLVFNLDASLFGRINRLNYELQSKVMMAIHRFYGELRRLRIQMANEPPKELRVRLNYRLRIEELTNYINFLTGNYLDRWKRGDRPRGRDTKWWEPWSLDGS